MKQLLYVAIVLITILSACQPEETNEPQAIYRLCPNVNAMYYYGNSGDTARCYVPNAITPNGDGDNELFRVHGYNINILGSIVVKDGSTVVYQNDSIYGEHYTFGWDGKVNGLASTRKNYDYTINGTDIFGHSFTLNGIVSVLDSVNVPGAQWVNFKVNCDACQFDAQWDGFRYDSTISTNEYLWHYEACE